MKKNHKPSHSKLDLHADDLSKRLQQEEKIKDEHELTNDGTTLWYGLKLSYNLSWDGNYCIPTEGDLEKKAAILKKAINVKIGTVTSHCVSQRVACCILD